VFAVFRCWSGQSRCRCLNWQTCDCRRLTGMSTSTCIRLQLHNWGDCSMRLSDKADIRRVAISLLLHGTEQAGQAGQSKLGASLQAVYAGMDIPTGMVSEQTRLAQHTIKVTSPKDSRGQAVCKRQSQCCTEEGTKQVSDTELMLCRVMPDWQIPKHLSMKTASHQQQQNICRLHAQKLLTSLRHQVRDETLH